LGKRVKEEEDMKKMNYTLLKEREDEFMTSFREHVFHSPPPSPHHSKKT